MVQKSSLKKVVVIVGPTGVGKTKISIQIAKKFDCEIINADQSQMRKELNIGTAKITNDDMQNIKHHLIDFLPPISDYSIKDFQDQGRSIINEMKKIPLIVGGSGLYVDALITNYDLSAEKRSINVEDKYQELSNEELYNKLYSLNPEAALKTHPNNRKRVLRYLEIILEKGKLVDIINEPYYDSLIIFLNNDREILYSNINKRCEIMFEEGWIEEVKQLKKKGYNIDLIKEIGYKDINNYLDNNITYDELLNKIKQDTRHYAKRQITWFKNKMNCHEITNNELAFEQVCLLINDFLNEKH